MNNLEIYNKSRQVPQDAIKEIKGGRLKGMSNINAQWRIEKLTELFGVCGFGWYYNVINKWIDDGIDCERVANVEIELFIKDENGWSKGIYGVGGSLFISKESGGLHTSDEAWKMATTDAISVASKQLGIGADIYFKYDRTKYTTQEEQSQQPKEHPQKPLPPKEEVPEDKWVEIDKILNNTERKRYWKFCKVAELMNYQITDMQEDFNNYFGYNKVNDASEEKWLEFVKDWYLKHFAKAEEEDMKYDEINFNNDNLPF